LSATADIGFPPATSKRQEPWRDRLVILSLWIWCALLSYPLFAVTRIEATTNEVLVYQTTGLLQFVIVALAIVHARVASALIGYSAFQATIVVVILLSLALQFHGPEASILEGIAYTVALLLAISCVSAVWTLQLDALVICLGGIAVIFATFGICAVAAFGWPEGRVVGSIHPNAFGSIMLTGFILSQFRGGPVMLGVRVACLVIAAAVSSRFAIVGCFLAFLVFELSYRPLGSRLVLFTLTAAFCLQLFPRFLTDLLALDDPSRNSASGFTGRETLWNLALAATANAPFGLGFKRPPLDISGHNGYLRLLLEFGMLGGGLIIASIASIVAKAMIEASLFAPSDDRLRRFACARAAGLTALAFASFFQPQLFNLGDIHGLAVILMLFSPGIGPEKRLKPA